MFTPSSQINVLTWDTAGAKTLSVPVGMTAMRLSTVGTIALSIGATGGPAGLRVSGQPGLPSTEVLGVSPETDVTFYAPAGAAVQVAWGVSSGSGGGEQGPAGPAGPVGPQGDPGVQGEPGVQGAQGLSVLNGTTAPNDSLGVDGEFYINTTDGNMYGPKTAGSWGTPFSLIGPAGAVGATGTAGAQGEPGPQGPQGAQGPEGPQGAGLVPDGYGNLTDTFVADTETAGITIVYVVNPSGDLRSNFAIPAGINGDMSRHVIGYNATDDVWSDYGQFTGLPGPTGPQGIQGPIGTQGPAGSPGANGADGRTIYNGSGAPSGFGVDGDYYVDNLNSRFYGPKAGGAWPTSYILLEGTQGPQGEQGPEGPQGPAGTITPASASDIRTGTDNTKPATAKSLMDALAPTLLTQASPIAWNANSGFNARTVMTANRTLGTMTNAKLGMVYSLDVEQGGSGSYVLTTGSEFDFGGATVTYSTAVGKIDTITAKCVSTSPLKFQASFFKAS